MLQVETMAIKAPATCCHHWVIDSPSGPISRGVCCRCGATRVFSNVITPTEWDLESVAELDGGGWEVVPGANWEADDSH